MSTAKSSLLTVEPRRPWRHPVQDGVTVVLIVGLAAVGGAAITALTGLAGKLGWFVGFIVSAMVVSWIAGRFRSKVAAADLVATVVIGAAGATVLIPWTSLIYTVISKGSKVIYSGWFTNDMSVTAADDAFNAGGVSHAIVGTLIIITIATLISVPVGIASAVYIVEIRGRFSSMVRFLTQAMSGVPSIVAGLFIYSTLVILVFEKFNALAGAFALAILMLPTVARTSEEVLKLVPEDLRSASYALGASQVSTTFKVTLPTVRNGLVTAAVLGVARIAGETAPLLLTSLYLVSFSTDLAGKPMATLPTYTFGNLQIGTENAVARAWGGSLTLLALIFVLFLLARLLAGRGPGK
jgi:phosphate transport system permease protein